MSKFKGVPVSSGLGILLLLAATFSTFGAAGQRHFINGLIPKAVAKLRAVEALPETDQLQLAISLPSKDAVGLDALLQQIYDPASPHYHQYLTPEQFTDKFGPTTSDYEAVIDFAKANGLRVTGTHPNRLVLDVAGSVADIEKTFQVKLRLYDHPTEQRKFYAPDVEPSVDASLSAPILSVSGLDDYSLAHPASLHLMPSTPTSGQIPNAGTGPGSTFIGKDFRLAYVPGTTLTGAGQSVALLQFDGYYASDIAAYLTLANLSAVTLSNVPINGGITTPGANTIEVSLDIEMAISMAPGLSKIYVYEAPNGTAWPSILSKIANDNLAKQISCSWGGGSANPNLAAETIFKQMAAQGQSFFNASGDDDAFVGAVTFPSDSTNITQVGGTTLTTASRGGTYVSETVWNRGNGTGTGGGISTYFSIPPWQQGINSFSVNQGSSIARNSPDVALTAENIYVKYGNGQSTTVGGTSCAAPLWGGFMALVNQQAATSGKPSAGFINPAVYEIANQSIYKTVFNDIITGNNTSTTSPNTFYAVPGYDLCTGLGTPKGTPLINALINPDPFIIVSNFGFNAYSLPGGGFNVATQTYSLTNPAATPLVWTLINTSAWLTASSSGATLGTGTNSLVTISLNTVASNLDVGNYSAFISFSNNTSGVAHSRLFTLKVSNSLLQNDGFETGDFTGWSLVGNSYDGTNLFDAVVGVNSLNDGSGPSFIHTGNYGAFLGDTNLATLSQTIQTVPGQNYVFSFWLANPVSGTGQLFMANWNTNSTSTNQIYYINNPPVIPWTNISFVVQATETNTTIQFGAQNPPNGFGLDDVSVTAIIPPAFTSQPTNQTLLAGSTAIIGTTVSGSTPLTYRWIKDNVSLVNGAGISGATTATLTLAGVSSSSAGNYTLVVTNVYGSATSSVASLIVLSPPVVSTALTNQTIQCGGNATLAINVSGASPFSYQWNLDGVLVPDATNNSLALTNVHLPSHTVSVTVTNVYGSVTNTALLTVTDTVGPVITLNGANPIYIQLGGAFSDPGATASDACAGPVAVTVSGTVNPNVAGTNLLTYTADDGNGNTNSATRAVIVQNTNLPPAITSELANPDGSFTLNLTGTPGGGYILETTTNIFAATFWQSITTNTFGTNGVAQFNDADATNFVQRFYRLKTAP